MYLKVITYQQINSHGTLLALSDDTTDHFRHTVIIRHTVLDPPVKVIDLKVTAVETAELTQFWEDMFHQQRTLYSCVCFQIQAESKDCFINNRMK